MGRYALPDASRYQRFKAKQGNIAYSSGVTTPLQISQTDYLTQLDIMSNQQVTTSSGTAVVAGYGAYGALGNVQVKVNGGRAPYSLPGYHANEYLKAWNNDYVDAMARNTVTVSTTNNWKNHIRIPLTVDPLSDKGAWYTGDTALNLNAVLSMNAVGVVLSTVAAATIIGSWDVWSEKYSGPQPDAPNGWLDQISYYKQTELYLSGQVLSNGTTTINLETDQDFVRIGLIFYTGSNADSTFAPAAALWTSVDLIINDKFHIFETVDEQTMLFEDLNQYYASSTTTQNIAAGTIWLDFQRFRIPTRDEILPTDPDQAKRLQLKIASTSASNKVDIITDTMVDSQFAEKWARSAKARGSK
jgi:hypothetical protein